MREVDYIKEKVLLSFKIFKEYKVNFYIHLFADSLNLFAVMIFYLVFKQISVNTIFDWTMFDFLVFFLIINFTTKFRNCFYFWFFRRFILQGGLNSLLVRPISTYLQVMLNALKSGRMFTSILTFIILACLFVYGDFNNYFLAFIIWLVGFIANLFLYNNIAKLGFFFSGNFGLAHILSESNTVARNYTYSSFENSRFVGDFLLALFPMAVVGFIVFQILNGDINYFYNYIFYFIIYLVIMVLINIFLWKLGLKKYEAFG